MIRALSILSGVLLLCALLAGFYGRQQARNAQAALVQLALTQERVTTLERELKGREQALEEIRQTAASQSARLQAGEKAAQRERRKGETRAYRLLAASVPDTGNTSALIRWATQEAQSLSTRLEATP